jgi:hypothetical protein
MTSQMKAKFTLFLLPAAVCLAQENNAAHKNELAFGLGGIPALSRSNSLSLDAGSGVAYQVNYGRRFLNSSKVALYGEINFVASPLREVSSPRKLVIMFADTVQVARPQLGRMHPQTPLTEMGRHALDRGSRREVLPRRSTFHLKFVFARRLRK